MGAAEGSPKRGASEAKGPAGPPEGAVFEELFGRAKSSPPEAECPEGRKARAAGQEKTTPEGRKEMLSKKPGPQAQEKTTPGGQKKPGRMALKDISQLRGPGPQAQKKHCQTKILYFKPLSLICLTIDNSHQSAQKSHPFLWSHPGR